jgi:hypothetical protein
MRSAIDQFRSNWICAFGFDHPTPSLRGLVAGHAGIFFSPEASQITR